MTVFGALVPSGREYGQTSEILYLCAALKLLILRAPSLKKHSMCVYTCSFLYLFVQLFIVILTHLVPTIPHAYAFAYTNVRQVYTYVCTHIHTHT